MFLPAFSSFRIAAKAASPESIFADFSERSRSPNLVHRCYGFRARAFGAPRNDARNDSARPFSQSVPRSLDTDINITCQFDLPLAMSAGDPRSGQLAFEDQAGGRAVGEQTAVAVGDAAFKAPRHAGWGLPANPDIAALIRATAAPLAQRRLASLCCGTCGRSSVVEHQLPKLSVEGSIPFARSN
jgi:hypothetical protein